MRLRQSKGPESLSPVSEEPDGRKGGPRPDLVGGSRVLDFIVGAESPEWFQAGEWRSLIDGIRKTADCWWRPELWEPVGGGVQSRETGEESMTVTQVLGTAHLC